MIWKRGTIVEDTGGNIQIVLFVDNNDTFKCMNTKGEINTFSVHCHKFRANNLNEYLSKPINNTIDYINGEAKTFSSRTKEAVLYQLKKLKQ
jgi:hypothetical protein